MAAMAAGFPEPDSLQTALTSVLGCPDVRVLERRPNAYESTFRSEVVTCQLPGQTTIHLFCKYGSGAEGASVGHRGGVLYEAEVYRSLLSRSETGVPRFYGCTEVAGTVWMFVEFVEGADRVTKSRELDAMLRAAEWLGRFHADLEGHNDACLRRYEASYFEQWARQTALFAARLEPCPEWLAQICKRFIQLVPRLLAAPSTVVHGEFYPHNILIRAGEIYPVDWESAAIAAGEIDLASLTERWDLETVAACEAAYQRSRWPAGAPADFSEKLGMARVYWLLRWLGGRPEWIGDAKLSPRFTELRTRGEELGWI